MQIDPEIPVRAVDVLVRIVEVAASLLIFVGAVIAFARLVWTAVVARDTHSFVPIRLDLARYIAVGLEFLLAADVLETAVAPSFTEIGQLAAVAAIRTALNYFLRREIEEERREMREREKAPV